MKKIIAGVATLFTIGLHAQWDTLNTNTDIRLNAIAADEVMGITAVGLNPASDSGACGVIEASGDNGNTWVEFIEPYALNLELWDIAYTSNGRSLIAGDSGLVILRTIWFTTYQSVNYLSQYSLRCVYPVNDSTFYCAGENGMTYRTFNYGYNWDTLNSGTGETINDIYFADAANGWIVADGGYMAVTSDSGSTWSFVSQPMWGFYDINSFAYQDTMGLNPYVVGESGLGLFSVNGGVNWFSFSTNTNNDINKIRFLNTISGIMCGANGYIYRSEDGGASWFSDSASAGVDLFDIAFAGDTTAFICGDSGVVLRSRLDISSVHHPTVASIGVNAYPNPTHGLLFVNLLLKSESNVEIQLVNLTGQVLQSDYYENVSAGENRFEVGTGEYAQGIYFLRVVSGENAMTLPVIKQ